MHLPPDFKAVVVPRRGRSAEASSPATDYFNPRPDQWEGKVSALLQVFVVYLPIAQSPKCNTNCYTSQRAPEMVPTRPAAPEMVPHPAAVGEAPSTDGWVLCLAACGAFVALRSSACVVSVITQSNARSRQIRADFGLLVRVS